MRSRIEGALAGTTCAECRQGPVPGRPERTLGTRIGPNTDLDQRIGSKQSQKNR